MHKNVGLLTLAIFGLIWVASIESQAVESPSQNCSEYLQKSESFHSVGIPRVESILGKQTLVVDVSQTIAETRAYSDPNLRIVDLNQVFEDGRAFLGFGRPNVYIGIPSRSSEKLVFLKVDAKSLKREDTKVVSTKNRVQSGLLVVFKDLSAEAIEELLAVAKRHEGTRRWTCVNANCRILSEAGFSIGGESLAEYYFPIPLFKDIIRYGLEYKGRPVELDIVKTTPGYLEDIGLSINQAVWSTLCRHSERACAPLVKRLKQNTFLLKIRNGVQDALGVAIFKDAQEVDIEDPPKLESSLARIRIPESEEKPYDMSVSEPSQLGTLLRMIWGPHSLFEIELPANTVNERLPQKWVAYPDRSSWITKLKQKILFSPAVISLIRSQLARTYKRVANLPHSKMFDMLRTDSDEIPNRYNFVMTGTKLIIMKINIRSKIVDWILSKHVLMSDYSDDVRMAGEVWKTADKKIHFNLNSGTYQPQIDLADAEALFGNLFPAVAYEGHEFTLQNEVP